MKWFKGKKKRAVDESRKKVRAALHALDAAAEHISNDPEDMQTTRPGFPAFAPPIDALLHK